MPESPQDDTNLETDADVFPGKDPFNELPRLFEKLYKQDKVSELIKTLKELETETKKPSNLRNSNKIGGLLRQLNDLIPNADECETEDELVTREEAESSLRYWFRALIENFQKLSPETKSVKNIDDEENLYGATRTSLDGG